MRRSAEIMGTKGAAISILLLLTLGAGAAEAQSTQPGQSVPPPSNVIHRAGIATTNPAGDPKPPSSSVTRVSLSLAAVLALIVILYWASRKMLPRSGFG